MEETIEIKVRIEATNSGSVSVYVYEPVYFKSDDINFGFISTTMAECYGTIIAAEVIKSKLYHRKINPETATLNISVNDPLFAEYILGETTPREKYKRSDIEYLRQDLCSFKAANINLCKNKHRILRGTNTSSVIPQGIFPNLRVDVTKDEGNIFVKLPNNPAVKNQFLSTFKSPKCNNDGIYILDEKREKFLWAWIYTTKGRKNTNNREEECLHEKNNK